MGELHEFQKGVEMIESVQEPHYPLLPGMESRHNIKVEVHKGELEHLRQLADTAIADFERLEEENAALKDMVAALQRQCANGTMWIPMSERTPTEKDGELYLLWEDGMLDLGYYSAEVQQIVTRSDRCLDERTGDEGHSVEWWMPAPPHPGKISPPVEMPAKSPENAYVVVLKLMDSWCLVGKKVFMKFDDAERFRLRAQETAEKILDTEEVKLLESYVPPRE
jgi:hypothetical protein